MTDAPPFPRLHDLHPRGASIRRTILLGLAAHRKTLPSKLLYDERGSKLFERICQTDDYYVTRAEIDLYVQHMHDIAARLGERCAVIEYGSGEGLKSRLLLNALHFPAAFIPVDISRDALLQSSRMLAETYRSVEVLPVCADYTQPMTLPRPAQEPARRVIFFPGSTIGNFHPAEAEDFLRRSAQLVGRDGAMIIGVDLIKPRSILEAAYNDSEGVTAAFNLNLLHRANAESHAEFDIDTFEHRAIWNAARSRVEMHIVSRVDQQVRLNGTHVHFNAGETIHTENSYKYTPDAFAALARRAGWRIGRIWRNRLFAVFHLHVGKS